MWFYRIEYKKQMLKIKWNTKITYLKNMLGILGLFSCGINNWLIASICLLVLIFLLGYYLFKYGNFIQKLRFYEKNYRIEYKGSKYSFKNPLIINVFLGIKQCQE